MLRLLALAASLALPAPRAHAQNMDDVSVARDVWQVIGWNDACGVAYSSLSYPKLGDAMAEEPVSTRVGTQSIPVGKEKAKSLWTLEADGVLSWSEAAFKKATDDLRRAGYSRKGYSETLRDGPIGDRPGLAETLLSTATLSPRLAKGWPGPEWRWAGADYSPLGNCALLVFEDRARPGNHTFLLVRVYNPPARIDRAYAHATNARLIFEKGWQEEGVAEAATAAAMAPDLAITHYGYASLLALSGRHNEAVRELAEAVKRDRALAARARQEIDFRDLAGRDDFRDLVK